MNREDFRRNFQQSYFGLQPSLAKSAIAQYWHNLDLSSPNPLIPCTSPQFSNSNGGTCTVMGIFKQIDGTILTAPVTFPWKDDIDEDTGVMYAQHPSRLGMIQGRDTAVFIRRWPQRNYNRGYTPRSCNVWAPNFYTVKDEGGVSASDPVIIWHVFNPYTKSLDDALDILDSGEKIGVVLGPWLAVCLEQGKKYPRLAYRDEIIGFVQNREPVVYMDTTEIARDYVLKMTGKYPKVK